MPERGPPLTTKKAEKANVYLFHLAQRKVARQKRIGNVCWVIQPTVSLLPPQFSHPKQGQWHLH